MSSRDEPTPIVLGPRTTVHALVAACPDLAEFLPTYDPAFARLAETRGRVSWARIATLGDVALEMNVSWRRLVRDLATEVRQRTGRSPRTVDDPHEVDAEDPRLAELRDIVSGLEQGGSLLELAARLDALAAGSAAGEMESLVAALTDGREEAAGVTPGVAGTAGPDGPPTDLPDDHPIASLRRESARAAELAAALRDELERLGGSLSRARWRAARQPVTRLVDGLCGVEVQVHRTREAWLPALERNGAGDAARLVAVRQDEVLDALRLVRVALSADAAASVVEHGRALCARVRELTACEEQVLVPVAGRVLTQRDWAEVRRLEDAAGPAPVPETPRRPRF